MYKMESLSVLAADIRSGFLRLKWYESLMMAAMIAIAGWAVIQAVIDPLGAHNPLWLSVLNFVSSVCGVICTFMTAKASVSNFVFGLINTLMYAVYLMYWRIYGTLALELFIYLPIGLMSWHLWSKHRDAVENDRTKSKKMDRKYWPVVIGGLIAVYAIWYWGLKNIGGTAAYMDAFIVSSGIVAVVMEMLRYREQYVLWIGNDLVSMIMYIVLGDPVYIVKRGIYLMVGVIGIRTWYDLHKRNDKNE